MTKTNLAIGITVIVALLAIGVARMTAQGQPADGAVGRYQLFTAEHAITSPKGTYTGKDILRIDTATGQTSAWVNGQDASGKLVSALLPIGN
ncbi:MAG: hypothetical protein ABSB15_16400 [Bryobacteraceae bacterium]|jgi:hypothetical protein